MKRSVLLLLACASLFSACNSVSSDSSGESSSESDALTAKKPIAYVKQFVGVYHASDPASAVQTLQLRASGSYKVTLVGGKTETGVYYGPSKPTDPVHVVLIKKGLRFDGDLVNGYGVNPTTLTITRSGQEAVLTLDRPGSADETLCDDSGGSWTDDEADPSTGLYCVCDDAARPYFIPSEGGCVSH